MNKMYVDIALKVLGNDIGWFAFQGIESQITYQNIVDALLKHLDGSTLTKKQDIEVTKMYFLIILLLIKCVCNFIFISFTII